MTKPRTYNGKRDPNGDSGYGWWYTDPDQRYRYELPPPYAKYQSWNPYLWRRDQPPPFWMYGDDKKYHFEFKKDWEKWYKGESKDWWNKHVPPEFKKKVNDLVENKVQKVSKDLKRKQERLERDNILSMQKSIADKNKEEHNKSVKKDLKQQRYLEEIYRLKNKIKDQELAEDLRHNYVYQILFENWKNKHKATAPYNRRSLILPVIDDPDRTGKNEWLNLEENHVVFPSGDEIDKMKLDIDFFDVDKFHKMNVDRISKLGRAENPADTRHKYDIEQLDDHLFGNLNKERQKDQDPNIQINPMYSQKRDFSEGGRFYSSKGDDGPDRKIHASTLKSNGGYDTLSRASDTMSKSVKFNDRGPEGGSSVLKRPQNGKYFYQSPFKTAAKMME